MPPSPSPPPQLPPPHPPLTIPVLLLKTRSHPHDAYEEYFSSEAPNRDLDEAKSAEPSFSFVPQFVPVLEHRPNTENLGALKKALESGALGQRYGGMIFTSQRAVEAWAEVVKSTEERHSLPWDTTVDGDISEQGQARTGIGVIEPRSGEAAAHPPNDTEDVHDIDDLSFPLYTVGAATARALNTLVMESTTTTPTKASPFALLRPSVLGEHTGTGGNLAEYILSHYNRQESQLVYTTRLPPTLAFTVIGHTPAGSEHKSQDGEGEAQIRRKKGLLFLVGEQRRDIIPKTLTDVGGKLDPHQRIAVDEVEVYATDVMGSFRHDFETRIERARTQGHGLVVVVVFSPQGCESMLRALGFIDEANKVTESAVNRWPRSTAKPPPSPETAQPTAHPQEHHYEQRQTYVVVTIGPTTRDYLKTKFGFEPDVCAAKPSPQGVGEGLTAFLHDKGLI